MINVPTTSNNEATLQDFLIELNKTDPCYFWGEQITGKVVLKCSSCHLDIVSLKLALAGYCKLKNKHKKDETYREDVTYLKKERTLVNVPFTTYDAQKEFSFQETLPSDLPTAIETKTGRIGYYLKATLLYKNDEGIDTSVHAARGITIVEDVDLNQLPKNFFEERTQIVQHKFGLFSCTGGQVRLTISVERTAFVSGESIHIHGKIENKTDRRVEKVIAVIQQRVHTVNSDGDQEVTETDVCDVHEDSLALFVDPATTIKIDKKMHIPVLPPSTPPDEISQAQRLRRRISLGNLRRGGSQLSLQTSQSRRILRLTYSLIFKVKSAGADILEVCWPVVVGSIPHTNHVGDSSKSTNIFKQCKTDKPYFVLPLTLLHTTNKTTASYINKYPFFAELKSSSKQSKKILTLAHTVRFENKLLHAVRDKDRNAPGKNTEGTVEQKSGQLPSREIADEGTLLNVTTVQREVSDLGCAVGTFCAP